MRIFKTKVFARYAKRTMLDDDALVKAIEAANAGLIDADLGGGVIKQRIARQGGGKSGGYRTLIVFKAQTVAFFVYGFAKNERDNITQNELQGLKELALQLLGYSEAEIVQAAQAGALIEVFHHEEKVQERDTGGDS